MHVTAKPKPYLTDDFIGTDEGCGIFIPANRLLYEFVRANPSNIEKSQIASKALIIGRSLAASVERRTISDDDAGSSGHFYSVLAESISNSMVGELLALLPAEERLSQSTITAVVKVHARLCDAVFEVTKKDSSSFASKYLHFHYPHLFPMMDLRARTALSWVANEEDWPFAYTTARQSINYENYVRFYLRVQEFFERELGKPVSLRQMDNVLLNRYDCNV